MTDPTPRPVCKCPPNACGCQREPTPRPADVPDDLVDDAVDAWHEAPRDEHGNRPMLDDLMRHILAAVLPAARKLWIAELFGAPEEIAARQAEPLTEDDTVRLCELARPGVHERQVRERVAAESAVLDPKDLAELLNYVVGRDGIRVVQDATLDRAFAALKATHRGGA